MKKLLLLIFLPGTAFAQTFFVTSVDSKSKEVVENKIKLDGYTLADSSQANYVIHLLIDGHYNPVGFKRPYQGYIRIVDNKTNSEVAKTPVIKRHPAALNGYNASYDIFRIISKRYLADELKKCKKS